MAAGAQGTIKAPKPEAASKLDTVDPQQPDTDLRERGRGYAAAQGERAVEGERAGRCSEVAARTKGSIEAPKSAAAGC